MTHDDIPSLPFEFTKPRPLPANRILGSVAETAISIPSTAGSFWALSTKLTFTLLAASHLLSALLKSSGAQVLPASVLRRIDVLKQLTTQKLVYKVPLLATFRSKKP